MSIERKCAVLRAAIPHDGRTMCCEVSARLAHRKGRTLEERMWQAEAAEERQRARLIRSVADQVDHAPDA